jgi:hypothetical protein
VLFEWASGLSLSSAKRCDPPNLWTVPLMARLMARLAASLFGAWHILASREFLADGRAILGSGVKGRPRLGVGRDRWKPRRSTTPA